MIAFGPDRCHDLAFATAHEWLETDGLGGYASGTISGAHTRRYHGHLVAVLSPPVRRHLFLSRIEEYLHLRGGPVDLSTNLYRGAVHPRGFERLVRFALEPFPTWTYAVGSLRLRKRLFLLHGSPTVVLLYDLAGTEGPVSLELRPLLAFRDVHFLTQENRLLNREVRVGPGRIAFALYAGLPALTCFHDAGDFAAEGLWYRQFEYPAELARGLPGYEDLYSPGTLTVLLRPGESRSLVASLLPEPPQHRPEALAAAEVQRRTALMVSAAPDPLEQALTVAADQFLVRRGEGTSVIAGYPWFEDWGRAAMASLPGLALCTGRFAEARAVLATFAAAVDQGMIPNRFPEAGGPPEWGGIDGSLWFVHACERYLAATGNVEAVRADLYPALAEVMRHHVAGTRYGIRVDADGLLTGGEPGLQLTWMDAKVGDWVVTPRQGKAVEVNALWHNACVAMAALSEACGLPRDAARYRQAAGVAASSFNRLFWNEAAGCCYDVVDGDARDARIRPNQLLAVSLPAPVLDEKHWPSVLTVVERDLLTPVGLRTLAPGDPEYRGRYEGDPRSRDAAYHQGAVWPWLLGPYATAVLRVRGRTREVVAGLRALLEPFRAHLGEVGLGSVSEIFDGDPPHHPRGCIAQAWSVAELLRVLREDLGLPTAP
ncbi:MAG: glycogen debranching enzyme family protein [candidate division NC10 bacterium]|nr:glycogen debranching enzyme family protein [candidate division NC10 bacterium]